MAKIETANLSDMAQYVNTDLMDKLGQVLNEAKVSVMTVHFTLAYMLANSMADDEDPTAIPVTLVALQSYMYQVGMNVWKHNQEEARKNALC